LLTRQGELDRVSTIREVLVLLPTTELGGAERHSLSLCAALNRAGARVTLSSTRRFFDKAGLRPEEYCLSVNEIQWEDGARFDENLDRQERAVRAILKDARPDLAMIGLPWPSYGQGLHRALLDAHVPHLLVAHLAPRLFTPGEAAPPERPGSGQRRAPPYCWVGVSQPVARRVELLFGLAPHSATSIENGVDVAPLTAARREIRHRAARLRLDIPLAQKLVLVVGRLDAAKGSDLLPQISEQVADLDPLFVCAGAGRLRGSLEATPAARSGRLQFVGEVSNVEDWLLAADVLLLPSRIEGFPLVFLEAAAARCPIVATDAALEGLGGDAPLWARLSPVDDVEGLGEALRSVLTSRSEIDPYVENAYRKARTCSKSAMMQSYRSLFRMLRAKALWGNARGATDAG
jgi:glycosyltransferase involved in cell wall biosynthesis